MRAWIALAVLAPIVANGQDATPASAAMHGSVRVAGGGGLAGASIVLRDSSGQVVTGVLTRADGTFVLPLPHAGTYRAVARKLGFLPDSSPLIRADRSGSSLRFDAVLTPHAPSLATVQVDARTRCLLSPSASAGTLALWTSVQAALADIVAERAAAGSDAPARRVSLRQFARELDPGTGRIVRTRTWMTTGAAAEPYRSVPAESLVTHGFVQPAGTDLLYAAPDAHTLLSDEFATTHCFRPVSDPDAPARVGLHFAPQPTGATRAHRSRDYTDIDGTLWLDRGTGALEALDFDYVPSADVSRDHDASGARTRASGTLTYGLRPSGGAFVAAWRVRVPLVRTEVRAVAGASGNGLGNGFSVHAAPVRTVAAVWEIGGDVLDAGETTAGAIASGRGRVEGRVVDSASGRGLRDVLVELEGAPARVPGSAGDSVGPTALRAHGDTAGRFVFDSIRPGAYTLRLSAPRLDTANVHVAPVDLTVDAGVQVSILIQTPSAAEGIAQLCSSDALRAAAREFTANAWTGAPIVLHGTVRDAGSGDLVSGAIVRASWIANASLYDKGYRMTASQQERTTVSDSAGRYVLCGVPAGRALALTTSEGTRQLARTLLQPFAPDTVTGSAGIGMRMYDITVGTDAATRGRIIGTVRDTSGAAVHDAQVLLLDQPTLVAHANGDGAFGLDGVPMGEHLVRVRAVGYAPLTYRVRVTPTTMGRVTATLHRAPPQLAPVEVRDTANRTTIRVPAEVATRLRTGHGSYLTAADIASRRPRHLTELLRGVPGVEITKSGAANNQRGIVSLEAPGCKYGMPVYIDGTLALDPQTESDATGAQDLVDLVQPGDVTAIEIYRGPSELPATLPHHPCGGIFIWTRQ